ncbi:E3 ubiquitin-protein ligase hrd1 [Savitreella phatthalungensis]
MSRALGYCALSTAVTAAVILNAFEKRPNFYASCVYLSQSSACLMVLTNMFLCMTFMLGKLLQTLLFGRLRAIETEHLYERAWYAVTETCLAMTIFRDEFDSRFFVFFTALLFLKIFHWLAQDRVEFMEQTPEVAWKFHARMLTCIGLLLTIDFGLVKLCMEHVLSRGPNVMIMFAFEFTILASSALAIAGKYALNLAETRQPEPWDNKSLYTFYLELVCEFVKLVTYLGFFATILTFYGLPLHIIRDLYVTMRSFTSKCANFMRFRRATSNMDAQYPDATVSELDATGDKTCIVCRDDMVHASEARAEGTTQQATLDKPKKLPCGHILHLRCLRSWLERQQSCPMCRRPVLESPRPARAPTLPPLPVQPVPQFVREPAQPAPDATAPAAAAAGIANDRPSTATNSHVNDASRVQTPPGLQPQIDLPPGFTLPPGWVILPELPMPTQPAERERPRSARLNSSGSGTDWRPPPIIPLFDSPAIISPAAAGQPSRAREGELEDELAAIDQLLQDPSEAIDFDAADRTTRTMVETRVRALRAVHNAVGRAINVLERVRTQPPPSSST